MKDDTIESGDLRTETYRGPRRSKERTATLRRGDSLGRYVVLDHVGAGGMGVVYAAYDPELNRRVAIKVLQPDSESSDYGEEARRRLLREAQALARVVHPNVVTIHDVSSVERRVFLAMEYVDGHDLPAALEATNDALEESWRPVLRLFIEAGRGLAAVHAAGLAHRDFKPSNVRVGGDGRVRILDFGLALTADPGASTAAGESLNEANQAAMQQDASTGDQASNRAADEVGSDSALLDAPLTRAGQIFGTPRYMAPEQHLGQRADAKSDQFSFCIALFEALYDHRPFEATNAQEMVRLVRRGLPESPPDGLEPPAGLYSIVARGLAFDPADRHDDLASLLNDLEQAGLRTRRRWRGSLAIAAISLTAIISAWQMSRTPPCLGAEAKLEGIWDPARQSATKTAIGEVAWGPASAVLDRYALAWKGAYRDACEATHVRQEQSPELLDLRMACLEDRRQEFRALTELMLEPSPTLINNASTAASKLSPLAPCADAERLLAPLPPPEDDASATQLAELRKDLSTSRAQQAASRQSQALAALDPVLEAAEALDYPPIAAEARLHQANLLFDLGDYVEASEAYRQAMIRADEGRHDDVRARAMIGLVWAEKSRNRSETAADWSHQARAAIRRIGDQPDLLMRWYQSAAQVALTTWDAKGALEMATAAFELSRQVHGERHLHTGQYLAAVASALSIDFRFEEALEIAERATEIQRQVLGDEHANIGRGERQMALQEIMLGRLEAAKIRLSGCLQKASSVRDDHLVSVYTDLGFTEARLGEAKESAQHLASALELAIELHGESSSRVAEVHNYFADAHLELDQPQVAERHSRRALELLENLPTNAVERVAPSLNLALAQARSGAWAAASSTLAPIKSSLGDDAFWRWVIDRIDGLVAIGQRRHEEAVAHLQSAVAQLERSPASSPLDIHFLRLELAQALRAAGRDEQAHLQAQLALDFFAAQGRAGQRGVEAGRQFLDETNRVKLDEKNRVKLDEKNRVKLDEKNPVKLDETIGV